MYEYSFEKLDVYKIGRSYVKDIYEITATFPNVERFALADQLQRAVVSITSNIAEGTSRSSNKDKAHFIEIAYGSLMETLSQLQVAQDLMYISEDKVLELRKKIDSLGYKLTNLRKSYLVDDKAQSTK